MTYSEVLVNASSISICLVQLGLKSITSGRLREKIRLFLRNQLFLSSQGKFLSFSILKLCCCFSLEVV